MKIKYIFQLKKNAVCLPYALPLCYYLVPLLKGPVSSTLGYLGLLQCLLQLLRDGLVLLPQYIDLLVGSLHVQSGRVLFLMGVKGNKIKR